MSLKGKTIQVLGDPRRYTVQDVGVLSHGLRAGFVLLVQDEHGDVTQVSVTQKAISEVGFHASEGADRFAVELRRTLGLDATLASDDAVLRAVRELQDSGGRRRPIETPPASPREETPEPSGARAAELDRQLYQAHEKIAALEVVLEKNAAAFEEGLEAAFWAYDKRRQERPEFESDRDSFKLVMRRHMGKVSCDGVAVLRSEIERRKEGQARANATSIQRVEWAGRIARAAGVEYDDTAESVARAERDLAERARDVARLRDERDAAKREWEIAKAANVSLRAKLAGALGCDSNDASILAAVAGLGTDPLVADLVTTRARLATAEANAASGQALRRRALDAILQMGEPAKPLDDEGVIERIHSAVTGYLALEEGSARADSDVHHELEAARASLARLAGLEKAQREAAADVERLEAVWRRYAEQREQVIAKLVAVGLGQHAGADPQRAILAGIDVLIGNAKSAETRAERYTKAADATWSLIDHRTDGAPFYSERDGTASLEEAVASVLDWYRQRSAALLEGVERLGAEIGRAWDAVESVRPKRDDLAHADAEFEELVGNRQHHGIDKAAAGLARLIRDADERAQRRTVEMRALEEQADARLSGLRAVETRLRQSIRIDEETPVGSDVDEHVAWMKRAIDSLTARADRTIAERPGPRVEDLRMIQVKLVEAGAEMPAAPLFDQIIAGIAWLSRHRDEATKAAAAMRMDRTCPLAMSRERAVELARASAFGVEPRPWYVHGEPAAWSPHEWVVDAIQRASTWNGVTIWHEAPDVQRAPATNIAIIHHSVKVPPPATEPVVLAPEAAAMVIEHNDRVQRADHGGGMAGHDEDADPSEGG